MAGRRRSSPKDRGAALVMVLWGAVIMSIIAAAAARQASTSAVAVNAGAELTRAGALADGGVRLGWSAFADGRIDSFADIWACKEGDDTLFVRLRPETARIDINVASAETLTELFTAAGASRRAAEDMADAAVAYRSFGVDIGDGNAVEPDGTEAPPPAPKPAEFRPGPFQTVEELGYLPGMDVNLFRAIADDVSVHSKSLDIDRRFASPIVRKVADDIARMEGRPPSDLPANALLAFEGSMLNVRAVAVTGSGAVFVRDAVIEGPIDPEGQPIIHRFVQGRLRADETTPTVSNARPCIQGFTALRRGV